MIDRLIEEFVLPSTLGALACFLAEVCDCHAIVTRFKTDEDPNWQTYRLYKAAIEKLHSETPIRFLIDLHGMTNKHNMGVAIGTISGESCEAKDVLPHFIEVGFQNTLASRLTPDPKFAWCRVVVDHKRFTGGVVNSTVTRYAARELRIPAVQIELSSEVRVVESPATVDFPHEYRGNPVAIHATVSALTSLVESLK